MSSRSAIRTAIEAVQHIQDPVPPWDDILSASRAVVGSDGATLLMFSGEHQLLLMHQQGMDAAAEMEYRQYYHQHDAIAEAALTSPAGKWWDTVELQRADGASKHPFYAEYLPRHRMRQVMAFVILGNPQRRAAISFQRESVRSNAIEKVSAGDVAQYLRKLAAAIAERERRGDMQLETVEAALCGLGETTLIATPNGTIQRCSERAYEVLRSAKMLASTERAVCHPRQDVLKGLLTAFADSAAKQSATAFAAPTSWGHGVRFDIVPAPAVYRLSAEQVLFVRLRETSAFAVPPLEDLAAFFALTPAEARVLSGLVAGHSAREYARIAGVAENTVRHQIASLMRKMSCSRQSELVRLSSLLL